MFLVDVILCLKPDAILRTIPSLSVSLSINNICMICALVSEFTVSFCLS